MYSPNDAVKIETVVLERIKYRISQSISASLAHTLRLVEQPERIAIAERFGDHFAVGLEATLLGEDLGEILFKYPKDWKESFKERWYPEWLLKKYPVQYEEVRTRTQIVYPRLKAPSFPEEMNTIRIMKRVS